jgi:hypothetical protein
MNKSISDPQAALRGRRIIERPDGFYWEDLATGEEAGPFASMVEAGADIEYQADSPFEPGETLAEAASEVGIADWVDLDTGELAEESVPHIEEH